MNRNNLKGSLISFIGVEGVGKSTQIYLLKKWLIKSNYRVKVIDIRGYHLLASLLWKFFLGVGRYSYYLRPNGVKTKGLDRVIFAKTFKLFTFFQFISIIPLILIRVKLPLFLNYVVISERYIIDTMTDILRLSNDFNILNSKFLDLYLSLYSKLLSRDAIFIYMKAKYSELINRYNMRASPIEWKKYIEKRNLYHYMVLEKLNINYLLLDVTKDTPSITFKKILTKLYMRANLFEK